MVPQQLITCSTRGRGSVDVTRAVNAVVAQSAVGIGLCHVFCRHTSASLMICENADPDVRADLERWFGRAVPDGDPIYAHDVEGPDDMPAHVRSILTGMDLTVPVADGQLRLGTWQGIYLYEHRTRPHERQLVITVSGAQP